MFTESRLAVLYYAHSYFGVFLCDSSPLINEICRRTLSFAMECLSNNNYCNLVSVVSRYPVNCCRMFLPMAVIFCSVVIVIDRLLLIFS